MPTAIQSQQIKKEADRPKLTVAGLANIESAIAQFPETPTPNFPGDQDIFESSLKSVARELNQDETKFLNDIQSGISGTANLIQSVFRTRINSVVATAIKEQTIDQKFNQREKDQSGARRALIARQGRSETGAQTLAAIRSADRKLLAGQSTEAKASRKRARDALLGQGRSVNLFADELGVA